jgi:PAP2 superfamily
MTSLPDPASETVAAGWWGEVNRLDLAVYAAIAATPTPTLDRAFRRLGAAPDAGIPLSALAPLVAYSRVHTGVHYPVDALVGSVAGGALAPLAVGALERCGEASRSRAGS